MSTMPPSSGESGLGFPLGEQLPPPGAALEVAPGVWWVRLGLPFALDHVNVWLLRDEIDGRKGWSIVDCGIGNEQTRSSWDAVFASSLLGDPVLRVVVTHMHPDHVGNAEWLSQQWSSAQWQCRVWMSAGDFYGAHHAAQRSTGHGGEHAADFYMRHGLADPQAQDKIRGRGNYYASLVPTLPRQFRRMVDGDELAIGGHVWRCMTGHGHSPEHIALHCRGLDVLISGDMLLPRISTNVSVHDTEPEADPLKLFLLSLDRMKDLPEATLVLPSHGRPFRGVATRIAQLQAHHEARLEEVLQACTSRPTTAADLLPVLFKRPLDLHQTTFAMGEAVAHLHRLWHQGRLLRELGTNGVISFRAP